VSDLYIQAGNEIRLPALGVSFRLPERWSVTTAGIARGEAHLWFQHVPYSKGGASSEVMITAAPEDHKYYSRLLKNQDELLKSYPRKLQLPFGEAFEGSGSQGPRLLFAKNRVIFIVEWSDRNPDVRAGAQQILQTLHFSVPSVDRLPPSLKIFKYLHPSVRSGATAVPRGLALAELRGRLEVSERTREMWAPDKPRVPDAELMATRHYASGPLLSGLWHVLLGELDSAKRCFAEAADLCEEAAFLPSPDLNTFVAALEAAILAGDKPRADRIARRYAEVTWPGEFTADGRAYRMGIPMLVAGDIEAARPLIDEARALNPRKAWYVGLGDLLHAVAQRDTAALTVALETVLKDHHAQSVRRSQIWNSVRSFICVPATVLVILAAWRGVALPADVPSRHGRLKNLLVIALTEFDGRQLEKGATFELEVDYIPASLIAATTEP
jgi:hypothetical protein